ncbi:MAG: hypothetical protein ACOVMP_04535 [Chthoniobacterales bacterium]
MHILKSLLVVALWFTVAVTSMAQASFRFYVFDETKSDSLHFESGQDITIYDFDHRQPRLSYSTEYRVYGINQRDFSFTTESVEVDISKKDFDVLLNAARALPIAELDPNGRYKESDRTHGWIDLDGTSHRVRVPPETDVRKAWQAVLDDFLAKHAPPGIREQKKRHLQGETTPAVVTDFATLLNDPDAFDGKRIRLSGFYHAEFECSSFAGSKDDLENYARAVWLNGPSTFADSRNLNRANKRPLTIEGTFEIGPGGHMGLWMGELSRITYLQDATTDPIEGDQSLSRRPNLPRIVALRHPRRSSPPTR